MSFSTVRIESNLSDATFTNMVNKTDGRTAVNGLIDYLAGTVGGSYSSELIVTMGETKATGTFTLDTVIATDAITINGVTFTAIASGATGNQFNVGIDDAATATNLAASINASASALVSGHVTAAAVDEVVTVTAKVAGVSGNAITIASADSTIVASGARLTSGADGTSKTINLGLA